jgi:prepilin signal peptidase PulO-like enzyme (type II secretory pathway)
MRGGGDFLSCPLQWCAFSFCVAYFLNKKLMSLLTSFVITFYNSKGDIKTFSEGSATLEICRTLHWVLHIISISLTNNEIKHY